MNATPIIVNRSVLSQWHVSGVDWSFLGGTSWPVQSIVEVSHVIGWITPCVLCTGAVSVWLEFAILRVVSSASAWLVQGEPLSIRVYAIESGSWLATEALIVTLEFADPVTNEQSMLGRFKRSVAERSRYNRKSASSVVKTMDESIRQNWMMIWSPRVHYFHIVQFVQKFRRHSLCRDRDRST